MLKMSRDPLDLLGKTLGKASLDKYMLGLDILIGKCLYELEQK